MVNLITEHIDIWTAAQTQKTNGGRGRGKNSNGQSPHGIKKLRELILELAVRGKLVPQDPNGEPASVLLEKIAKEKAQLIKEGKIKTQKPLPEISEDEKPFELPEGWKWARIGDVGHDWGQKKPDNDFTYIEVSGIDNVAGIVKSPNRLTAAGAPSRARKIVKVGTVIYSTVRPYLQNICVIDQEYSPEPIASTAFAILHPLQQMPGKFFTSYLRSPVFVSYVESVQTGIAYPAINDKQFLGGLVPIPPLTEQHRIVAKVDELMALCDQLEQQQTENNASHQTLVGTLLSILTSAADQGELAKAWQRITEHLDTLFTTEQSIDQLKQTILQLAVMGKLVPQDPNDEPASVLLEKSAAEKARLTKEGKIKKQKPLPEISEDEKPFELPEGWKWARLGDVTNYGISDKAEPGSIDEDTWVLELEDVEKETSKLLQKVRVADRQFKSSKNRFCEGDVIYGKLRPYLDKAIIADEDGVCTTEMIPLRGYDNITPQYLRFVMKSPYFIWYANESTHGMNLPRMGTDKARLALFPMVSEAEQHLIVAKVDELMALCETLKARLNDAQTTQVQLADAIVEQAVA